ncbi:MAG: efflux RND transporter periplasmic adaptor subunit [Tidjanibacter sp.]|nr:efflux RND transporter periplasmic adaptor subunit [Tidjanibacter sp.]
MNCFSHTGQSMSIVMLAVALLVVGCKSHKQSGDVAEPEYSAAMAVSEDISRRLTFTTRLTSNVDIVIQPRVAGYLLEKRYKKGMPVRKGELIYVIDPSQTNLTVSANRASLSSARAMLTEAENNYRRALPLAELDAISQTSLDQYRATYEAAKAQVTSAEAALNNSTIELGYTKIYSPIDGIIGDTSASVGDLVGPGTEFSTLSTVSDVSIVGATLSLPFASYLAIVDPSGELTQSYDNSKLLSNIELLMPDGTPYPHAGYYSHTEKNVGSASGSIQIAVNFPNPEGVLKAGQYASVKADVGMPVGVVMVPQRAVDSVQGVESLWVVGNDGEVEYRAVEVGETFGDMWIIESGLSAGEVVLTEGLGRVRNGQKVKYHIEK